MKEFKKFWSIAMFSLYFFLSICFYFKKDLKFSELLSLVISANIFFLFNLFIVNKITLRKILFIDNKTLEKLCFDFNVAIEEENYLLAGKLNKKITIKKKLRKIIK